MAKHNELGKWGENIACDYLTSRGYVIRERNWRQGHMEIDIVAETSGTIAIVEVKTRNNMDEDPLEAVDARKRSLMVRSANAYMTYNNLPHRVQFDLIAINGTPDDYELEHIPDAFDPPLKRNH